MRIRRLLWDVVFAAEATRERLHELRDQAGDLFQAARGRELRRRRPWLVVGARLHVENVGPGVCVGLGDEERVWVVVRRPERGNLPELLYPLINLVRPTAVEPELVQEDLTTMLQALVDQRQIDDVAHTLEALRLPSRPGAWAQAVGEA